MTIPRLSWPTIEPDLHGICDEHGYTLAFIRSNRLFHYAARATRALCFEHMRAAGWSMPSIARLFNCSHTSVRYWTNYEFRERLRQLSRDYVYKRHAA